MKGPKKKGALIYVFIGHWVAWRILVPWPRMELAPSVLGAQSFNHWTAREVFTLNYFYLIIISYTIS